MRYQTLFHPERADPAFTLMLMEIEGHSPEQALARHLDAVMAVAHRECVGYFGADLFTRDELMRQVYVVDKNGHWHSAREVAQATESAQGKSPREP